MERASIFVLDASVAVKWYSEEKHRDIALDVRRDYMDGRIDLVAPGLLLYEVGNAVRFHPGASETEARKALRALAKMQITTPDLDESVTDTATRIAFTEEITLYDAVYLALAKDEGTKVITADEALYNKLKESRNLLILLKDYGSRR